MVLLVLLSYYRLFNGQRQIRFSLLTHAIGIGVVVEGTKILIFSNTILRDYGPTLICILSRSMTILPTLIKRTIHNYDLEAYHCLEFDIAIDEPYYLELATSTKSLPCCSPSTS